MKTLEFTRKIKNPQGVASNMKYIFKENLLLTACSDSTISIWKMRKLEQKGELTGHTDIVLTLWLMDQKNFLASGSRDQSIRIWNLASNQIEDVLTGHTGSVLKIVGTEDSRYLISGSEDMSIIVWDFTNREKVSVIDTGLPVRVMLISSMNQYLLAGLDNKALKIWNLKENRVMKRFTEGLLKVKQITTKKKMIFTAGNNRTVAVWDKENLALKYEIKIPGCRARMFAAHPTDDLLLVAATDMSVIVWNHDKGYSEFSLKHHTANIVFLAWYDQSSYISASSDGMIVKFDLLTNAEKFKVNVNAIHKVILSNDKN